MRQTWYIFQKEFKTYFVSPIAYIVMSIFLVVTGWFFFSPFFLRDQASMRYFFDLLPFVFAFVAPAITMKLFSEELNTGSYELLMTLPVNFRQVLSGKLAAATAFIAMLLVPTIFYAISVAYAGSLDWGTVVGGYLGALMLGLAFSAIGLWASALTRNQIIAFIIAAAICFGLTILDGMLFFLPDSLLAVFQYLAAGAHFKNIAKGVVDSRDILYFLSLTFISLYGAHLALSEKQ